jgi:ATP-dependent Zn protease
VRNVKLRANAALRSAKVRLFVCDMVCDTIYLNADPVFKVSIIPTAKGALGYTMQTPKEDQYLLGERELRERMAAMLGGRAAELLDEAQAQSLLCEHRAALDQVARTLQEREVISADEIARIARGEEAEGSHGTGS